MLQRQGEGCNGVGGGQNGVVQAQKGRIHNGASAIF